MNAHIPSLATLLMAASFGLSACGDGSEVQEEVEIEASATGEPVVVED